MPGCGNLLPVQQPRFQRLRLETGLAERNKACADFPTGVPAYEGAWDDDEEFLELALRGQCRLQGGFLTTGASPGPRKVAPIPPDLTMGTREHPCRGDRTLVSTSLQPQPGQLHPAEPGKRRLGFFQSRRCW